LSGAASFLLYEQSHTNRTDDGILFSGKVFYDSGDTASYPTIVISGTLTGTGLLYPNNTRVISCEQQINFCSVSSVDQIGPNQIGRMDAPLPYPIKKWDEHEVIATDDDATVILCYRTTITIDRKQKTLLWVEEPINQTRPSCKNAETTIRKYSIEDSPGWKRMRETLEKK